VLHKLAMNLSQKGSGLSADFTQAYQTAQNLFKVAQTPM